MFHFSLDLRFLRAVFWLLLLAPIVQLSAQTAPPPQNYVVYYNVIAGGMVEAGDGNFYTTTPNVLVGCRDGSSGTCSYVYQFIRLGETLNQFHTFQPVNGTTSNADGYDQTALIVGTDGSLYGTNKLGGPGSLGTIYKITMSGQFSLLATFGGSGTTPDPGSDPVAMIQGSDGKLYFTNGIGLYSISTSGGSVNTVYTFPYDSVTQRYPQGCSPA
jgi:uncharacterized repeat protein (TIGR03803 family)